MFSDPVNNLKQFDLRENMIVADLGAGSGFYAVAAAKMVPMGKVYAVEILPDLVTAVRNKAKEAHVSNLEVLVGDLEEDHGSKLADATANRVIASNILFQLDRKDDFIKEIKRVLRPDGQVLLVDWSEGGLMGPRQDAVISKETAREMFEIRGFEFVRDIDAGEYHYGMIFETK